MNIQNDIKKQLETDCVVLYMKGLPHASNCSFSGRVVEMLEYTGVPYTPIDVLKSDALRSGIKEFAGVRTLPLLFIQGEYIGGSDDIRALFEANEFEEKLNKHNVILTPKADRVRPELLDVTKEQIRSCSKSG